MKIILNAVQEDHGSIKNCQNLHGPIFEKLFVTALQDRYERMCGLHAFEKKSQLMQQSFAVEDPYQNMLPQISSFSFVLVLTL